jgi:probable HAF family extracellular repeat protein
MRTPIRINALLATGAMAALLSACGGGNGEQDAVPTDDDRHVATSPAGTVGGSRESDHASTATARRRYSFTVLGTLGGDHSTANALNNDGQIVGCAHTSEGKVHASLWTGAAATDLDFWDGGSCAYGINSVGQIVGHSNIAGNDTWRATLWADAKATDLGAWAYGSVATAINDKGYIVGWGYTEPDGVYRAALWAGTEMIDLGATAGNTHSQARSLNNDGVIVGWSETTFTADPHATAWSSGSPYPLGPWNYSAAYDINEAGRIVGIAATSSLMQARAQPYPGKARVQALLRLSVRRKASPMRSTMRGKS